MMTTTDTPIRKLLVCGLGRSGKAVAHAALTAGLFDGLAQMTIVDGEDSPELRESFAELERLAADRKPALTLRAAFGVAALPEEAQGPFELGVISPGFAPADPLTVSARRCCAELISELEFAWRLAPATQQWVAITGSNGKTTTTLLVAHLLRGAGRSVASVGNIGEPVTNVFLQADAAPDILVVEASSFQLDFTTSFAPQAAALLNVTPDHLNWHGSLENYAAAKRKIFAHQHPGDLAVIWEADPFAPDARAQIAATSATLQTVSLRPCAPPSAYLGDDGRLWLHTDAHDAPQALCRAGELPIKGEHNILNALFAACLATHLGLTPAEITAGLMSFAAPAHRLELVAEVAGVRYYDDSKATNPDSVRAALTAFAQGEAHLLVGGRGKGTPYDDLARVALPRVRALYAFGEEGPALAAAFSAVQAQLGTVTPITICEKLADAVAAAAEAATPGEAVVLSPACASFDEFHSYAERGEVFAALVRERAHGAGAATSAPPAATAGKRCGAER